MANTVVQQINSELENLQKELIRFKPTVDYLNDAKANVNSAVNALNKGERDFHKKVAELQNTYESFIQLSDSVSGILNKIDSIDFPERLSNIETSVTETISILEASKEATLTELQKASEVITKADFAGKFSDLNSIIEKSVDYNKNLAIAIQQQKLPERINSLSQSVSNTIANSFKEVEQNTEKIANSTAKSITDLNLPFRFEKLDANVAGILAAVQNTQTRLENIERNLSDKIKDASAKQGSAITTLQNQLLDKLTKIEKANLERAKNAQIINYITWGIILASALGVRLLF